MASSAPVPASLVKAAPVAALGPAPGPSPVSGPSMPGWQLALIIVVVIIVIAILVSWYASGNPLTFFMIFNVFSI